jgi:hypothetical protein
MSLATLIVRSDDVLQLCLKRMGQAACLRHHWMVICSKSGLYLRYSECLFETEPFRVVEGQHK